MRIEGRIIVGSFPHKILCASSDESLQQGFDEFMNVVIDEAAEVFVKDAKPRRELGACLAFSCSLVTHVLYYSGRILLKGDNITLIQQST